MRPAGGVRPHHSAWAEQRVGFPSRHFVWSGPGPWKWGFLLPRASFTSLNLARPSAVSASRPLSRTVLCGPGRWVLAAVVSWDSPTPMAHGGSGHGPLVRRLLLLEPGHGSVVWGCVLCPHRLRRLAASSCVAAHLVIQRPRVVSELASAAAAHADQPRV